MAAAWVNDCLQGLMQITQLTNLPHNSLLSPGDASVLSYDVETDTCFLCAHRDYAPGEEVHDSYGPGLSPSDLLCDYGFVDPANTNDRCGAESGSGGGRSIDWTLTALGCPTAVPHRGSSLQPLAAHRRSR